MGKKSAGWLDEVKEVREQISQAQAASADDARKAREKEFQEREAAAEALDKEATQLAETLETVLAEVNSELFSGFVGNSPVVYNSAKDPNAVFHFLDWTKATNYDLPFSSKNVAYEVFLLGIPIRDLFNDKRLQFEYVSFYYLIFADFLKPSELILRSTWRGHRQSDKRIYITELRTLKPQEETVKTALTTDLQRLFKGQLDFCYVQYRFIEGINVMSRSYGVRASPLTITPQSA